MLWEGKSRQTDTLATKNVHGDLCRRQTHSWEDTHSIFLCSQQLCHWLLVLLTSQMTWYFPLSIVSSIQGSEYFTKRPGSPRARFRYQSEICTYFWVLQGGNKMTWKDEKKTEQWQTKQTPKYHKTPRQGKILWKCLVPYFIQCLNTLCSFPA